MMNTVYSNESSLFLLRIIIWFYIARNSNVSSQAEERMNVTARDMVTSYFLLILLCIHEINDWST